MTTCAQEHGLASPDAAAMWLRRAWGTVFSFEAALALFLFAGRYKNDPRFAWIPIDMTVATGALSVLAALVVLYRRRGRIRRNAVVLVGLFMAFAGYAALSLLWTPGVEYARTKALYLAGLVGWAVVATAGVVAYERVRVRRLLVALVLFAVWMALETSLLYMRSGYARLADVMGSNYLGIGRCVGLGVLVVFAYLLYEARGRASLLACLALLAWLGFVMLMLPGRGPLLATVVPMGIPLLAGVRWRRRQPSGVTFSRSAWRALVAVLVGAAAVVTAVLTSRRLISLLRIATIFVAEGGGLSAGTRLARYHDAVHLWLLEPLLGHGIGAFPIVTGFSDTRVYPHQMLLETLVELGLVGAVLLIGFIVYAFRSLGTWTEIKRDSLRLAVLMVVINTMINAAVSGDLPDNRVMFAMLGLMVFPWRGLHPRA